MAGDYRTPSGWTQEEDALKLVLDEHNALDPRQPYLAREAGLSRYERVRDYDFAAGDAYWAQTGAFWADVRAYWERLYAGRDEFALPRHAARSRSIQECRQNAPGSNSPDCRDWRAKMTK